MALTMADATAVMLGGLICEDRVAYFTECYSNASGDADLQDLITALGLGDAETENVVAQMTRIGDAVQELQAALPSIKVSSHLETRDAVAEIDVDFIPAT